MSSAKREIEATENMYRDALEILQQIGAIKYCTCGKIFYETFNLDKKDIYAIATNKLKELYGEIQNYKLFHNQIDTVLSEALDGNYCEYCNSEK